MSYRPHAWSLLRTLATRDGTIRGDKTYLCTWSPHTSTTGFCFYLFLQKRILKIYRNPKFPQSERQSNFSRKWNPQMWSFCDGFSDRNVRPAQILTCKYRSHLSIVCIFHSLWRLEWTQLPPLSFFVVLENGPQPEVAVTREWCASRHQGSQAATPSQGSTRQTVLPAFEIERSEVTPLHLRNQFNASTSSSVKTKCHHPRPLLKKTKPSVSRTTERSHLQILRQTRVCHK